MKRVIVFMLLTIVALVTFGQVPDSTFVVGPGEAALDYLKDNLVIIIPLLVGLFDAILAAIPKFKSSTILQFIWNMIVKVVYKKFEIPTTKVNFMTVEEIARARGITDQKDIQTLKTIL